jgi:hypothetical protein
VLPSWFDHNTRDKKLSPEEMIRFERAFYRYWTLAILANRMDWESTERMYQNEVRLVDLLTSFGIQGALELRDVFALICRLNNWVDGGTRTNVVMISLGKLCSLTYLSFLVDHPLRNMPDKILRSLVHETKIPEGEENCQAGERIHSMLYNYYQGFGNASLSKANRLLKGSMIISKGRSREALCESTS